MEQGTLVNDQAVKAYHRLYCGMSDAVEGQLTSRVSQILKRKLLSLLDFRNFEHYSDNFPGGYLFVVIEVVRTVFRFCFCENWTVVIICR
jgi:hypothetical protein